MYHPSPPTHIPPVRPFFVFASFLSFSVFVSVFRLLFLFSFSRLCLLICPSLRRLFFLVLVWRCFSCLLVRRLYVVLFFLQEALGKVGRYRERILILKQDRQAKKAMVNIF